MKIRVYAVLAGASLALLLTAPAMAKTVPHHAHAAHHFNRHSALYYDYRTADSVHEEFADAPHGRWMRESREDSRYDYRERREVIDNLRGNFTGGVGYGMDGGAGFVDGYGQTHYFVGSFRHMNRLPHGPYAPRRFMPSRGRGF